ncbi:MAG TPA: TetR/AcrR family transcriptional regulator [Thermoleophilia bacterium]|nr:TetR/AcrR family transcriptional regulator [Thermoleophilia bacterium]
MSAGSPAEQRIVTAALGLIAERGISGVTMSAVAERAGVARQTLYNHFADVETIVAAAYERHLAEAVVQLRQMLVAVRGPEAKLALFVRHQVAAAAHSHHGTISGAGLSPAVQQRVRRHQKELAALVESILHSGVESGVFRRELDADAAALFTLHLLGAASELVAERGDVATVAEAAETMVLGGVRPSAQR